MPLTTKSIAGILALLLVACILLVLRHRRKNGLPTVPTQATPALPASGTVTLYGDSIIRGEYLDRAAMSPTDVNARLVEPIAATLERLRPGLQVDDRSRSGQTLVALASGFASDPRASVVVVIENGVIDAWQGRRLTDFVATLGVLVEQVQAEGRVPVLTGFARQVAGPFISQDMLLRRDLHDRAVRGLAQQMGVVFADLGAARFDGAADLLDGVHPAKPYSDRLAERIALALDAAVRN
ncbi:SGNH/GDSL hydrolase family protein [Variovorax paradoxus]|uniref:SGNH hydrolase-type esterase domain-containing protein n=1 Tax=Variovorax paradoxus TaxID=34073 RepID=A0A0H2MLF5_VARPD|nr:SGNH/GDSL hydrolase family protein [Variovorax paradoxus]KLN57610.1 hypothetical protein VPARA_11230 [Variovorax paradoxus]